MNPVEKSLHVLFRRNLNEPGCPGRRLRNGKNPFIQKTGRFYSRWILQGAPKLTQNTRFLDYPLATLPFSLQMLISSINTRKMESYPLSYVVTASLDPYFPTAYTTPW